MTSTCVFAREVAQGAEPNCLEPPTCDAVFDDGIRWPLCGRHADAVKEMLDRAIASRLFTDVRKTCHIVKRAKR